MFTSLRPRTVSFVSALVLAVGAIGALIAPGLGFTCPWRAIGLACPGCGCSRAAQLFLTAGPFEAFSAQPTATLLLLALTLSAGVGLIRLGPRWSTIAAGLGGGMVAVSALANLVFQLGV